MSVLVEAKKQPGFFRDTPRGWVWIQPINPRGRVFASRDEKLAVTFSRSSLPASMGVCVGQCDPGHFFVAGLVDVCYAVLRFAHVGGLCLGCLD
ncbi:uncharacterized protein B0I36DRAFT_330102 [Microdochium trichocladiopsis]|uniref:Uncharacterized protein n=1 Tax=Microdochium trichocladiopsis TaxID=1682393 RepID=A0A9P8XZY7_9PEZI|nr:uncharacterized protein B0I36DRAFT_330102 [Microdochium trichocladiopsis]KAH7026208.1 hypothetical protein B0I36DRAFT_330102 [Microdochium trichocladiopsis]